MKPMVYLAWEHVAYEGSYLLEVCETREGAVAAIKETEERKRRPRPTITLTRKRSKGYWEDASGDYSIERRFAK